MARSWTPTRLVEALVVVAIVPLVLASSSTARPEIELGEVELPELDGPWIDTSDREAVVTAYGEQFGSELPEIDWRGDQGRCEPGVSSERSRQATLGRVNFYRAMAGVMAVVTEEPAYSAKAQQAALMMSAEGELTHEPADDFACFSPVGQEAAANSNLYLGRTGPRAIDGYIEDPGDSNVDVGHRSTILHPPTRKMGVGDVGSTGRGSSANALWVFDDRVFDEESPALRPPMREADRFVAWPPRGYIPAPLTYPRWSFTRSDVDLSQAEVSMYRPWAPPGEREVPLRVIDRSGAPGHVPLPTIVWEPAVDRDLLPTLDEHNLVVITGVDSADSGDLGEGVPAAVYSYDVQIIGAEPNPGLTAGEVLARLGRDG